MSDFILNVRRNVTARSGCRHFCADYHFEVFLDQITKDLNLKWIPNYIEVHGLDIMFTKMIEDGPLDFSRAISFSVVVAQ